jgi:hypothetical protein
MAGKEFQTKQDQSMLEIERANRNARFRAFEEESISNKQEIKDDPLEIEADNAARQIVHGEGIDATKLSSTSTIQQTKHDEFSAGLEKSILSQLKRSKGSGQKLDDSIKDEMEENMNVDLSDVRIHMNSSANQMSDDINAKAFAHGQDIYFNRGNFDTNSIEGKELLAHELAHTQQQGDTAQRRIQRSMKFEIQTRNHVYAIKEQGTMTDENYDPDPILLNRKIGTYSTALGEGEKGASQEGGLPAYLSRGIQGEKPGDFVEMTKSIEVMEKVKTDKADSEAQFELEYIFTRQIEKEKILGTKLIDNTLKLQKKSINQGENVVANTFEYKYFNFDGLPLDIHLDKNYEFRDGHIKLMKVGRQNLIDKNKKAQYLEVYKINNADEYLIGNLIGKPANIKQVGETIDNAQDPALAKNIYMGAWNRKYYKPSDFARGKLKADAKNLEVHVDNKGILREGHIKFLEQVPPLIKDEDSSTIEIQSEHGGFIEFETPKWFRKWSEIEPLIQEAVDFTGAIDKGPDAHPKVVAALKNKHSMDPSNQFYQYLEGYQTTVKEWPKQYSTDHLKKLKGDNRELVVVVSDPFWTATIQGSESIELSEYESLVREHEGDYTANFLTKDFANKAFDKVFNAKNDLIERENQKKLKKNPNTKATELTPKLEESLFINLKGFLLLIYNYIYKGQVLDMRGEVSKSAFRLMARTNFASMYENLLSNDEKLLYIELMGDPEKNDDNPLFTTALNERINGVRQQNKRKWESDLTSLKNKLSITTDENQKKNILSKITNLKEKISRIPPNCELTRNSNFWYSGVGSSSTTYKPIIYEWLLNITKNKDLLDAEIGIGLSGAMGSKTITTEAGKKDYMQTKFEIRGSEKNIKGIDNRTGYSYTVAGSDSQPAFNWVQYTKAMFDGAKNRSNDTPDDLTTEKNEASKTGLKE